MIIFKNTKKKIDLSFSLLKPHFRKKFYIIFIFILISNNDSSDIIIKLTVVTGAIIRILPSLNKVINSFNIKKYSLPAVDDIFKFLKRLKIKKIILNIFFQFLPQLYILGLQNFLV